MRELLVTAFEETIAQIKADLDMMSLSRWNESVFRFMYSRAITAKERTVIQFFECGRIDLVFHHGSERAFVEFKFYAHPPRHDPISGKKTGRKGLPSSKNLQEFKKSVSKLRECSALPGDLKLVALFYSDPVDHTGTTYDSHYGDISGIEDDLKINRLHSVCPFLSNGSECHARLYEVLV